MSGTWLAVAATLHANRGLCAVPFTGHWHFSLVALRRTIVFGVISVAQQFFFFGFGGSTGKVENKLVNRGAAVLSGRYVRQGLKVTFLGCISVGAPENTAAAVTWAIDAKNTGMSGWEPLNPSKHDIEWRYVNDDKSIALSSPICAAIDCIVNRVWQQKDWLGDETEVQVPLSQVFHGGMP